MQFLLDTGSALNCLRSSLCDGRTIDILPARNFPVGVSGRQLVSKGEVELSILLGGKLTTPYRFTLMPNLHYEGILGIPFLDDIGFSLLDKENVKLGNTIFSRVTKCDNLRISLTVRTPAYIGNEIFVITSTGSVKPTPRSMDVIHSPATRNHQRRRPLTPTDRMDSNTPAAKPTRDKLNESLYPDDNKVQLHSTASMSGPVTTLEGRPAVMGQGDANTAADRRSESQDTEADFNYMNLMKGAVLEEYGQGEKLQELLERYK